MSDTTPALDDFLARYDADDNEWWRLDAGDQLNLFNEAVHRMRDLERRSPERAARRAVEALASIREGLRGAGMRGASVKVAHMTCHAATVSSVPQLPPDIPANSLGSYPPVEVCDWNGCPVRGVSGDIQHCFLAKRPDKS